MIKQYNYKKNDDTYLIVLAKDCVVTNWDYKGVCFLSKNFDVIDFFPIEESLVIDRMFVDFDGQKIALYCPENASIFILDIRTKQIQKIEIPSYLELDEGCLTPVYYWQDDEFVVQTRDGRYFRIDTESIQIAGVNRDRISSISLGFDLFISQIGSLSQDIEVITFFSKVSQLTYQDSSKKEIGFIDYKNNIHITSSYDGDDVHAIYFVKNKFIVLRCNTIESVADGEIEILMQSKAASEFRRSVYDHVDGAVYIFSRYWRRNDQQMTLYSLRI